MSKEHKWRRTTQAIIIIVLILAIIWDVIVAITPEGNDTISESTRDYSIYPVLPAFMGGLCGHFFFWEARLVPGLWGMTCAIGMILSLTLWSVLVKNNITPDWLTSAHVFCSRRPMIVCAVSAILGGIFWGLGQSTRSL